MGKIYVGQTALTIQLTVGIGITGAAAKIAYKKPSGTEGSWDADITDEENGVVEYDIESASDLNESGKWKFWADITFMDESHAVGEPIEEYIYTPGT